MFFKKVNHTYLLLSLVFFLAAALPATHAQVSPADSLNITLIDVNAGLNFPAAALAKRYGFNGSLGLGYTHLFTNRWTLDVRGDFLFGDQIKNEKDVLSNITTSGGYIIDREGTLKMVDIFERGFAVYVSTGKLLPKFGYNPNTGLLILAGAGYLQHKYRFEIENNNAPQLETDFKKGYDHLCGGPTLRQFIGYYHLGNSRKINYYIGLDLREAFTFSLRPYYINEMKYADEKRFDILAGIKFGWVLPMYKKTLSTYYYE